MLVDEFPEFLFHFFLAADGIEPKRGETLLVFFLGQLFVKPTITLVAQIHATETVLAIAAVIQKLRVNAVV